MSAWKSGRGDLRPVWSDGRRAHGASEMPVWGRPHHRRGVSGFTERRLDLSPRRTASATEWPLLRRTGVRRGF